MMSDLFGEERNGVILNNDSRRGQNDNRGGAAPQITPKILSEIEKTVSQVFDGDRLPGRLNELYTTPSAILLRLDDRSIEESKKDCSDVVAKVFSMNSPITSEINENISKNVEEKYNQELSLQRHQSDEIKNSLNRVFPDNSQLTVDTLDELLTFTRNAISCAEFELPTHDLAMNTPFADDFRLKKFKVSQIVEHGFKSFFNDRNLEQFNGYVGEIGTASFGISDSKQIIDSDTFYKRMMVGDMEKYSELCDNISKIFKSVTPENCNLVYIR